MSHYRADKPWVIRYPPAGTITGRLICEDEPAVAAQVGISASSWTDQFSAAAEAITDAQGHFELSGLPAGQYTVTVKLGTQSLWQAYPKKEVEVTGGTTTEVELALQRATPVSGRVVEEGTGTPVPGVVVLLEGPNVWSGQNSTTTDEDGRYLLYALPVKTSLRLYEVPEQYVPSTYFSRPVTVGDFEVVVPDFELKHGASIHGIVVDDQGRPVKWAEVTCSKAPSLSSNSTRKSQWSCMPRPAR